MSAEKAKNLGADKVVVEDLSEEFISEYVFPMFRCNTIFEGEYLLGTAIAKVMFNELVSISSPVFSISITYLLPIVAIGWGVLDGEIFTIVQWLGCILILCGVYLVTDKKHIKNSKKI